MKSNLISKSETAEVIKEISNQWKIELPKIKNLKFHYLEDEIIIITGTNLKAVKTWWTVSTTFFPSTSPAA